MRLFVTGKHRPGSLGLLEACQRLAGGLLADAQLLVRYSGE